MYPRQRPFPRKACHGITAMAHAPDAISDQTSPSKLNRLHRPFPRKEHAAAPSVVPGTAGAMLGQGLQLLAASASTHLPLPRDWEKENQVLDGHARRLGLMSDDGAASFGAEGQFFEVTNDLREERRKGVRTNKVHSTQAREAVALAAHVMFGDAGRAGQLTPAMTATFLEFRAANTCNTYASYFMRWSRASADTPSEPLPADPFVFAAYLAGEGAACQLNGLTAAPVDMHCNAIKYFSRLADVKSPTTHPLVAITHESLRRLLGYRKQQKRPLMAVHIEALYNTHVKPYVSAIFAAPQGKATADYLLRVATMFRISLGFEATLRWDDLEGIEVGDMVFSDGFVRVFLVHTKTDVTREGQWCTFIVHDAPWGAFNLLMLLLNAVAVLWNRSSKAMRRRMVGSRFGPNEVARLQLSKIPVMFYIDKEYCIPDFSRKVTYNQFLPELKRWCAAIGLDPNAFACHSWRIGAVNDGLNQGIPETILQSGGRWKSLVCFRGYINDEMSIRSHVKAYTALHAPEAERNSPAGATRLFAIPIE